MDLKVYPFKLATTDFSKVAEQRVKVVLSERTHKLGVEKETTQVEQGEYS